MAWLNNARILSAFAVLLLHVGSWFVLSAPINSVDWWAGNMAISLTRWCVPVFVMISGVLLLDSAKTITLREFYLRRASKVVIPLLFWSLFYLIFTFVKIFIKGDEVNYSELTGNLLQGKPYYHLWYLYMIVFIYLFSPFFKKVTDNISDLELTFLVFILFSLSSINAIA